MKNLNEYVKSLNAMRKMFKNGAPLDPNNATDRKEIREHLECDLSPENLCCDGELPQHEVLRKARYLEAVGRELDSLKGIVMIQRAPRR